MNILFIGLGRISQRYIRILRLNHKKKINNIYIIRHSNSSLVINDDLSSFSVKDLSEYYSLKKTNINLIKNLDIDVAFIANAPSKIRYSIIEELVKQKIHIFCEKPIFPNYNFNKISKINNLIKRNKIIFFSAYQLRYHDFFIQIQKDITNKKYGKLRYLKMEIAESFHLFNRYTNLKNSHYVSKKLGGGVLLAQCHEIDILHYLFQNLKIKKVNAPTKPFLNKLNVDMLVNILFTGMYSNFQFPIQLNMNMLDPLPKREGYFYFEKKIISYDLRNNISYQYNFEKNILKKKEYKFERIDLFKKEVSDFFSLINHKKINYTNFENGLLSLKTIDKIKKKL